MARGLVETLLALHAVDVSEVGLEGFGRPSGYLERQLLRMHQRWQMARFRQVPEIDRVGAWLAERIPVPDHRAMAIVGESSSGP